MSLDSLNQILQKRIPNFEINTVIDVGAYVGQSAGAAIALFPHAKLFCFEPAPETFKQLSINLGDHPNVKIESVALGAKEGRLAMTVAGASKANRISLAPKQGDINVEVTTGDGYLASNSIDHVDFLKIDTEGYDLEALIGFRQSLGNQKISLIEIEAGLHSGNKRQASIERLKGFLEPMGYLLFMVHDFRFERQAYLRRCSAAFISQTAVAEQSPAS